MRSNGSSNGQKTWKNDSAAFADLVLEHAGTAVAEAVAEHHRAGNPVAVWRDGRVVLLYPDGSTRPVEKEPAG